ncbi:hypothetical protein [Yoonia sp. SS1-5]|uniref:Uncharacterized protein n=1 Tax=Yoonia rhodophyticola TaxID=3137370 RepID=A0AAN0MHK9_9RHOB
MNNWELNNTRLFGGVWEAELSGTGPDTPKLQATHDGVTLDGLQLTHDAPTDTWHIRLSLPATVISDGVQTIVISDAQNATVASFSVLSGAAAAEDLRAEISLLRSELDMLKRSFRRHCTDS